MVVHVVQTCYCSYQRLQFVFFFSTWAKVAKGINRSLVSSRRARRQPSRHSNLLYVGGYSARRQSLHAQLGSFHTTWRWDFGRSAVRHVEQGGYVHASHQYSFPFFKRAEGFAPQPPLQCGIISVHAFCARGVTEASVPVEDNVVEERGGLVMLTQAALENTGPSLHSRPLPLRCARNAGCQVECSSLVELVYLAQTEVPLMLRLFTRVAHNHFFPALPKWLWVTGRHALTARLRERAAGAPPPSALLEHRTGVLHRVARPNGAAGEVLRTLPLVACAALESHVRELL